MNEQELPLTEQTGPLNAASLAELESEAAVDALLRHAAINEASDLHILSDESCGNICMRRLGRIEPIALVPRDISRQLIAHVKAMSGMDIADRRRPGEGRWLHAKEGRRLDIRISCIGTLFGEDLTMRLWNRDTGLRRLDLLGLSTKELEILKSLLARPSGLLLVTGPTGTGKTTTLYACLSYLNNGVRKINTLEDPIEYAIDGIRQSQVNPKIEVDFPELLRHILRQAPDVIMVGEIRDEETAVAAVRAANSGHLVLSTLHAPVSAAAAQSMLALGAPPYFLSSCLLGIVAQRLVRTLCLKCRQQYDLDEAPGTFDEIQDLLEPGEGRALYGPGGCDACQHTGYARRTGLFEIMTLNREIRRLIADHSSAEQIAEAASRNGMLPFRRGALLKVAKGLTSTEEILQTVPAEFLGIED
jgi:type II secretory ATPase GspE/PulE/Tfp pilus assembly ATPase PilB-like protein